MPTDKPRLTVTLSPSLAAVLRRLCELTGQSQSSTIAELLEGSQPVFERLIQVLEAAQKAKSALKEETKKSLENAESALHEQLGITMDIFDDVTGNLLKDAEAVSRRAATRRTGRDAAGTLPVRIGGATPSSNRGVTNPKVAKKTTKSVAPRPIKTASGALKAKPRG